MEAKETANEPLEDTAARVKTKIRQRVDRLRRSIVDLDKTLEQVDRADRPQN